MKYFVSADVTFFEFIPYFSPQSPVTALKSILLLPPIPLPAPAYAPNVSSPVSSEDTIEPTVPKHLWDFRYVYTHRQKVFTSEPVLADSSSKVEEPSPQPLAPPYNLNVLIAVSKGK